MAGMPETLPGTPVPRPEVPTTIAWTVSIAAAPLTSPIVTSSHVIVAHLPGTVASYRRDDGRELWRAALLPDQPLATDGTLVFVTAGEAIHALRIADGSVAWRAPSGILTAPLVVKDGWMIAATAGKLTARRSVDGSAVWSVDAGVQRQAGAVSGDTLFVPQVDGRLVARQLADGATKWERRLAGSPVEPLVVGDALFFGANDKNFYCLNALSGDVDWQIRVGASIRGRAASDGHRVFFVAVDNLVRAVDRRSGALRWLKGVAFRPSMGPVAAGGSVLVAGPGVEVRMLTATDGATLGAISFPARITLGPGWFETGDLLVLAAVTGGLEESWKLSLTRPISLVPGP